MRFLKKFIPNVVSMLLVAALMFLIGCNVVVPPFPPNPEVNPTNDVVDYIRVYPLCGCKEIKVDRGEEVDLIVRGYNNQDQWVILETKKLKRWRWTANMCPGLLQGVVDLESNGLFATFVSEAPATFYVAAYYVDQKQCVDYVIIHVE